jgi:hypothetical protein
MGAALEAIVIVAVGVIVLFWAAVATLSVLAVRWVRRRYRATVTHDGWTGEAGRRGLREVGTVASATLGTPGWWISQHDRRRMWRAVRGAEQAVKAAQKTGAPVGDLPTVTRQLVTAARGVDAVLRASALDASSRHETRAELARIESASSDVRRAALDSLRLVTNGQTDDVVAAARIERTALAAGVRAVRTASDDRTV